MTGAIWALDLGAHCGFAVGAAGASSIRSGTILLKRPEEARAVALSNMIAFLNEEWSKARPALVVKESALPLQAFRNTGNSEAGVLMAYALHGIVEAMSCRFGVRLESVHPSTVRKHFIGKARTGTRTGTKLAVVERCHLLGYFPKHIHDSDRGDACAIWDFAAATFGGRAAKVLHLFNERAA